MHTIQTNRTALGILIEQLLSRAMQILFIISVLSFLVLLWAVYGITRHVRKGAPAPHEYVMEEHHPSAPQAPPAPSSPDARQSA